jgi:hypothetical protein
MDSSNINAAKENGRKSSWQTLSHFGQIDKNCLAVN